jgi:heme oxygenase
VTEVVDRVVPFSQRLRAETADLHDAVEAVADLPGSVRTRADYGDLLLTFHAAHSRIEGASFGPGRSRDWRALGIDIAGHRQLGLVTDDLTSLGLVPDALPSTGLGPTSAAEALGCLYVVEGSAIGRRVLSPLLQAKLGDLPTAFFDGVGRHPVAWRAVQRSLASLAGDLGQQQAVLVGARTAFKIFLEELRRRAVDSGRGRG